MRKRVIATVLCAALILCMLPAHVFAVQTEKQTGFLASFSNGISVDGALSESTWMPREICKSDTVSGTFDAAWSRDNTLYLAIMPDSAATIELSLNGKTLGITLADMTLTGELADSAAAAMGDVLEISIPFAAFDLVLNDYAQTVPFNLTLTDSNSNSAAFEGCLGFWGMTRSLVLKGSNFNVNSISSNNSQYGCEQLDNGIRMYDLYKESGANAPSGRSYMAKFSNPPLHSGNVRWLEFDFYAKSMPEYSVAAPTARADVSAWGIPITIIDEIKQELDLGITNTADGLYVTAGTSATTFHAVKLNRDLGDKFHLGIGWTADNRVVVYCDGVRLAVLDGAVNPQTGNSSKDYLMFNCWRSSTAPASATDDIDVTITNIALGTGGGVSALDLLELTDILGLNTSADAISSDLNLVTTFDNGQLQPVELEWTSSAPEIISTTGKVTPAIEDTNVMLTAAIKGNSSVTKTFEVTVCKLTLEALLVASTLSPAPAVPTLDDNTSDPNWITWKAFNDRENGTPSGAVSVLWNKDNLYLGLRYQNADTLTLEIAGKTFDYEGLTNGTMKEIAIPFTDLGVQLTDYNQVFSFQATLGNSTGDAKLEKSPISLQLTGKLVNFIPLGYWSADNGNRFTKSGVTATYEANAAASALSYLYIINQNAERIDHSKDMIMTQDIMIESMPVGNGTITNNAVTDGIYFWITNPADSGQDIMFAVIYNSDSSGNLKLSLGDGTNGQKETISLDRKVGDTFRLSILWKTDKSVWIYVDGELKGAKTVGSFVGNFGGGRSVQYRYSNSAGSTAKFTLSNFSLTMAQVNSIKDQATVSAVLGSTDLSQVSQNLNLPTSFNAKYLGIVPLSWKSSDPDIIAEDGTVNRPKGMVGVTVRLTLYAGDQLLWSVDAYVLPTEGPQTNSPSVIHTAFTEAAVTVDGSLADEGWTLNTAIRDGTDNVVGRFGTQWRAGKLYLILDAGSASSAVVTLNQKTSSLDLSTGVLTGDFIQSAAAVSGSVVELEIPLSELGVIVDHYDILVPITVTLDGSSFSGNLKLTSIDWFRTDNSAHRFPVLLRGSQSLGSDAPTEYQGTEQLSDGYRFYDLYNPDGTNAAKIRSYVIFMGGGAYQPLADITTPTYAEFDFFAQSMPIYEVSESIGWKGDVSNYGLACGLAGQQDANKISPVVLFGIFNTADGLVFAAAGKDGTETVKLNKVLGQLFRVGILWDTDGDLVLYIDGVQYHRFTGVQQSIGSFGDRCFSMNLYRNDDAAAKSRESFDFTVTNISLGKSFGTNDIDALTFDDIRGSNTSADEILSDLNLVKTLVCPLKAEPQSVTWTSSNAAIDSQTGAVTRPATGIVEVTLTATLPDGSSKTFELVVVGENNNSGTVLVVTNDYNPGTGAGTVIDSYKFTLDETNNSVIKNLEEKKTVNVVALLDGDAAARMNESVLTLWVSDDNENYTQVEGFKLLHQGRYWYLYDFEAEGQYIKVHCTHYDPEGACFTGVPAVMIDAWYEDIFGAEGGTFTETEVTVTNQTDCDKLDSVWTISMIAQQVYLDGEMLYHYVEDGVTYVRIPEVRTGETVTLTVLSGNGDAKDISNKEAVYEVSYGTREVIVQETDTQNARWITTLPDGTLLSLRAFPGAMYRSFSYDEGRTWTPHEAIECTTGFITDGGGFILDSHTGYIFYEGHSGNGFVADDMTKSDMHTYIICSKDNGVTWERVGKVQSDSNYILSYSNGIELSTYDGIGPNVDFVFPLGSQYNNNGAFCARVAYSTDAGLNWQTSDSKIVYGNAEAFEGGISEANILERSDGTLVLYARCQIDGVDNFAVTYSYDHGLTWVENAELSDVYTVNTQPVLYSYDGQPLMIWSGNNVLGGTSYMRVPLNVAVSLDEMESFVYIQDLFSKYSLQCLTSPLANYAITNPTATKAGEDTLVLTWSYRFVKLMLMRVDNFTDYLYRTKGAYDSFEHGTVKYEGWESVSSGVVVVSDEHAAEGDYSMKMSSGAAAARSIPYLQNGRLSFQVYADEAASFTMELQSAYSNEPGKAAPVGITVENNEITFLGGESASGLKLRNGWNTLEFSIEMDGGESAVMLSVNGSAPVQMPVNTDIGDYICFVTVTSASFIYIDDFLVEDYRSAKPNTVDEEVAYVEKRIDQIGTVTLESAERIAAARAAYDALTEEQKALVSNYDVLVAAEAALKVLQEASLPKITGNLSLNETIDINFIIPAEVDMADAVLVVKNAATGEDVEYTILPGIGGTTVVRYSAKANHMTDEITVQVFDADGNALTQMASMSVRKYAGIRLTVANDTEKMMLIRMLDYGALAQINSGVNTDLANSIVTDDLRAFADAYDWADAVALEVPAGSGGVFKAGLALNETIDVTVYTTATNVADGEKFVVKCNGEELTEDQYIVRLLDDGRYVIRYSVKSNEMSDEIYIAIVGEDNTVKAETTLGVRIYAQKFLAAVPTGNQAAMLLAMLDYGAMAQLYAGTNTDDLANCFVTDTLRQTLISYPWPAN